MKFSHGKGFLGGAAQHYIEALAPVCPICGAAAPDWTQRFSLRLTNVNRYQFHCGCCQGVLSVPVSDVLGMEKMAITSAGYVRAASWHRASLSYVEIEAQGKASPALTKEGERFTLEEFRDYIASLTERADIPQHP